VLTRLAGDGARFSTRLERGAIDVREPLGQAPGTGARDRRYQLR
jgi:hypothetical protein